MRLTTILILILLIWVAFDRNLFISRGHSFVLCGDSLALAQDGELLRQRKHIQRRRLSVIPPWLKGGRLILRSKCSYKGTKSRDVRASDQRKIRRRNTNM